MEMKREWIEKQGEITVAHLANEYGSADISAMKAVQKQLLQLAEQAEPPLILLNLADTESIGTEFVSVLLLLCDRLVDARGGRFALCNVKSPLLEVLEATHGNRLWLTCITQDEAILMQSAWRRRRDRL